jgi:AcrR family transcriptional regulator
MSTIDGVALESSSDRPRVWRYGELNQAAVVEAGLRLTRRSGFANLSMRKLAAELGSPSMNAYHYVHDKSQLLDLVGDAVLGEVPMPPAALSWERQLILLFEAGRDVLLRYPGVAQHLLRRTQGLPNEIRLYTAITQILGAAGFDRVVSDRAQRLMAYLLFGAVASELATAEAPDDSTTMKFSDDREVFSFGLQLLVDGLQPYRNGSSPQSRKGDGAMEESRP